MVSLIVGSSLSGLPGGINIKRCPLGFLCKWTDPLQFERAGLENHQAAIPHSPEFDVAIAPVFSRARIENGVGTLHHAVD